MPTDRVLVNFFYAHPVGHAVEALYYCLGYHAADPEREIAVVLNSATAVELADFCPFVSATYAVDHSLVDPVPDSLTRLAHVPRDWDWVVDDFRRYQDIQFELFPGLRDYHTATDTHFRPGKGRTAITSPKLPYAPRQHLRLELPAETRAAARQRLSGRRRIAVLPAGSSDASLYPSTDSWHLILDALADAYPDTEFVLVGKLGKDDRTSTALDAEGLAGLLAHRSKPVNAFDLPLAEQLAIVEACDVFLSPHSGFGLAALAVGTPWLTLSGGRWFEYFFNGVPFRSIIPDTDRFPCFFQFDPVAVIDGRTPSMSDARIRADLPRIVAAAGELMSGSVSYPQALRDYFTDLVAAHHGDASGIWSIDGVHADYVR
ncbi:MAG: hypothetical protein ABW215_09540 [Kibdelosporangium sp.]